MTSVYSHRFAAGDRSSGGSSTVYTVPDGFVAVLRDIAVTPTTGSGTTALINLSGVAIMFGRTLTGQYVTAHEEGRWVLNAGDAIEVQSVTGEFQYVLSGYLLSA